MSPVEPAHPSDHPTAIIQPRPPSPIRPQDLTETPGVTQQSLRPAPPLASVPSVALWVCRHTVPFLTPAFSGMYTSDKQTE